MNVILNSQNRCTPFRDRHQRKTLCVVDVSRNWATTRHWQTKVLDTWKVTQLNLLRQKSVTTAQCGWLANMVYSLVVGWLVGWLLACLTSQQHASVSRGRICSNVFTCCHIEVEAADQTFCLTQSQCTDTGPTSPSADPRTPGRRLAG